ncbi:hypothetical protein GGR76_000149 [Xanthomonas translucens]|nr:hypothetical protein [Xanthomonas campestris]
MAGASATMRILLMGNVQSTALFASAAAPRAKQMKALELYHPSVILHTYSLGQFSKLLSDTRKILL